MAKNISEVKVERAVLQAVEQLVRSAGQAVLDVYRCREQWGVERKADDSPVTAADLAAHRILVNGLPEIMALPVLSEESDSPPFEVRRQWRRYWLIDPLDGTKEFVSGNGEFTVNVALIEEGCVVLGVVMVPVSGSVYSGVKGLGAFRDGTAIHIRSLVPGQKPVVVASRRHGNERSQEVLANLERHFGEVALRQAGSSLKFCQIAEGVADCYPRFAPTCEWDTAAAQAILEAAGGQVLCLDGQALNYNRKEELLNPFFVAVGDVQIPWEEIVAGRAG